MWICLTYSLFLRTTSENMEYYNSLSDTEPHMEQNNVGSNYSNGTMHWTAVVWTQLKLWVAVFTVTTSWMAMEYNQSPLNRCSFVLRCYKPLGPLILTVSCPAPAPRVSQMKRDWNVARTPCSIPGPYTRTLLGSGAPATRKENGLPGTWSPDKTNGDTDKHRSPSKNNDPHYISVVHKK